MQPHPDGGLVVVIVAADGTRELLTFAMDGAVVSNRKITGEGAPRALTAAPDGLYVITNIDNGSSTADTSAIERFSYKGDLLETQPVEFDGLILTAAQYVDGRLAVAGNRVLAVGSIYSDIWVGMLNATGGIAWQHSYDHVGLADQAEAIAFDGTTVALIGNVQPEEDDDSFFNPPNHVYFALHTALDGALRHQEIVPGDPKHGILVGTDIAKYGDGEWALVGTSTSGILASTWWTAIADTDGIRLQQFDSELGDNVAESVVAFGDDVFVGGRRGAPIPTAAHVVGYTAQMSSRAWEWAGDESPDFRDFIHDMFVDDSTLYVASTRFIDSPIGGGGSYTESLTVCSFRLN